MTMNFFCKLLVYRPILVLFVIFTFCFCCIFSTFLLKPLPDFSDPTLGFEARGTDISKKLTTWKNLIEETRPSGSLTVNPKELLQHKINKKHRKNKNRHEKKRLKYDQKMRKLKEYSTSKDTSYNIDILYNSEDKENDTLINGVVKHYEYGKNISFDEEKEKKIKDAKKKKWERFLKVDPPPLISTDFHSTDGYFCESPNKEYVHFVIKRNRNRIVNESMFDATTLLSMCELEYNLIDTAGYTDLCQKKISSNECCRPWSLPNYIALISNKSSCFEINDEDVALTKTILFDCYSFYHGLKLNYDCSQFKCSVPDECSVFNAVYNILHFLTDREFIRLNGTSMSLSAAMLFLPIARSKDALPFYQSLMKKSLQTDLVSVVAMDMGIKNTLFDDCLLSDAWLVGIGGCFVIACVWLYTSSFFVTINTIILIVLSLGMSYFIYVTILRLRFFPFMNLLVLIVIVGIGSDDTFIFMKIWHCIYMEKFRRSANNSSPTPSSSSASDPYNDSKEILVTVMSKTLQHASLSMLVTSLTTAAAFFASYGSSITAVKCFGIFAGTTVMVNYILMITYLPAAVLISERIYCFSRSWFINMGYFTLPVDRVYKFCEQIRTKMEIFVITLVIEYSAYWIILLGSFGLLSVFFITHYPKLKLPDTPNFRLFIDDHPFEIYEAKYKDYFWFEKMYTSSESFKLPIRFIWGIKPEDTGDYLDPMSRGKIQLDDTFNVSAPESQVWLLQFCKSLKLQPFYQMPLGVLLPNCFIENLISWMNRKCKDSMSDIDRSPCCESVSFPYPSDVFEYCLPESIFALYETPREFFIPGVAGPKFKIVEKSNMSVVKALVVEGDSNQSFSHSYNEIEDFVNTVQYWFSAELVDAPPGMKNGFFISELDFFDLQDTLSKNTFSTLLISMGVALLVLLFVSLNVLVSLYAIVTVTLSILSIIGTLVLLGWKLNILESVAVSTAIGLAVDFSLHYGVQYRYSSENDRKTSTKFAFRMIGPTLMSAITTAFAGVLMLPSKVLAYTQIGILLVVSMSISWIFSTFFLMSLLSRYGPQFRFGQFSIRKSLFYKNDGANRGVDMINERKGLKNQIDGNIIQKHNNDQLLSTSSSVVACDFMDSETHQMEMDSLSNSVVKTISLNSSATISSMQQLSIDHSSYQKKHSHVKDSTHSINSSLTVCQIENDLDLYKL